MAKRAKIEGSDEEVQWVSHYTRRKRACAEACAVALKDYAPRKYSKAVSKKTFPLSELPAEALLKIAGMLPIAERAILCNEKNIRLMQAVQVVVEEENDAAEMFKLVQLLDGPSPLRASLNKSLESHCHNVEIREYGDVSEAANKCIFVDGTLQTFGHKYGSYLLSNYGPAIKNLTFDSVNSYPPHGHHSVYRKVLFRCTGVQQLNLLNTTPYDFIAFGVDEMPNVEAIAFTRHEITQRAFRLVIPEMKKLHLITIVDPDATDIEFMAEAVVALRKVADIVLDGIIPLYILEDTDFIKSLIWSAF